MNLISLLFCTFGGLLILANWSYLISRRSLVPPFGGVLFVVGLAFMPQWRNLSWIGLIIDAGFWIMLLSIPAVVGEYRRGSPSRLHLELCGKFDDVEVRLSLFRPDYYKIILLRIKPLTEPGWHSRASSGTWACNGRRTELISHADTQENPSRAVLTHYPEYGYYEVSESSYTVHDNFAPPEYPPAHFRFEVSSRPNG